MDCLCHSGKPYKDCCQPFHQGELPENAEQLMRSRYCGYANGLAGYIMETTHPESPQRKEKGGWLEEILKFGQTLSFDDLIIEEFIDGDLYATVTFVAKLSQRGQNVGFRETSLFEKVDGKWLYVSGEISAI